MGTVGITGLGKVHLSGPDFAEFRLRNQLDVDEIATWLGLSEDEVLDMEKHGAPKVAALALSAIEFGLRAWSPHGP